MLTRRRRSLLVMFFAHLTARDQPKAYWPVFRWAWYRKPTS